VFSLFRLDVLGWLLVKKPAAGDKGQRTDLHPPLKFIAKVSSLAFAMSANAAEDTEHILFSGKSWQRLQAIAQRHHSFGIC
jgi:hypothetical protein